MNYFTIDTN